MEVLLKNIKAVIYLVNHKLDYKIIDNIYNNCISKSPDLIERNVKHINRETVLKCKKKNRITQNQRLRLEVITQDKLKLRFSLSIRNSLCALL